MLARLLGDQRAFASQFRDVGTKVCLQAVFSASRVSGK